MSVIVAMFMYINISILCGFCNYTVSMACSNVQPPGIAKKRYNCKNQLSISDELKKKLLEKIVVQKM